jgi:hypothetical protein
MALGCGLTSVRGNRGKNYKNEPLVPQKHTKKKKIYLRKFFIYPVKTYILKYCRTQLTRQNL